NSLGTFEAFESRGTKEVPSKRPAASLTDGGQDIGAISKQSRFAEDQENDDDTAIKAVAGGSEATTETFDVISRASTPLAFGDVDMVDASCLNAAAGVDASGGLEPFIPLDASSEGSGCGYCGQQSDDKMIKCNNPVSLLVTIYVVFPFSLNNLVCRIVPLVSPAPIINQSVQDCYLEIFHLNCVSLDTRPSGEWFCPDCVSLQPLTHERQGPIMQLSEQKVSGLRKSDLEKDNVSKVPVSSASSALTAEDPTTKLPSSTYTPPNHEMQVVASPVKLLTTGATVNAEPEHAVDDTTSTISNDESTVIATVAKALDAVTTSREGVRFSELSNSDIAKAIVHRLLKMKSRIVSAVESKFMDAMASDKALDSVKSANFGVEEWDIFRVSGKQLKPRSNGGISRFPTFSSKSATLRSHT
ncbi:hypothetical protein HDU76_010734, partial [Blyttiomyces sp. JEL0837]